MLYRRLLLAVFSVFLLAGCQKPEAPQRLIMDDLSIAVAPFTQPRQTAELLSGFIPEDQARVDEAVLDSLDEIFRQKLSRSPRHYVFLGRADVDGDLARDTRGRRNALTTWAARARAVGADIIIVPQLIDMQERVGSEAGVMTPASVNEDFYLIDARDPATLLQRSHFAEEQKALTSDLTKIASFFKRGGKWLTAQELAAEGMDKAVEELGL